MGLRRSWCGFGFGVFAFWITGCVPTGSGSAGGTGVQAGVEITIPNEGHNHVPVGQQVTYQANPPASGPHWSAAGVAPVAAGVYQSALEEEQWVHDLEHGYVVLLYDCHGTCPPGLLNDLQALFDAAPPSATFGDTKLVITPYDGLPFSFTVVAWDWQLHLKTLDQQAVLDFYGEHVDQGPEAVP
ncbi:MAG: DUF3105 domain-containing protein [Planctomycetes bacterium]|nr:DUF3105 domain-containing protein [Planctomycetota bacterium]